MNAYDKWLEAPYSRSDAESAKIEREYGATKARMVSDRVNDLNGYFKEGLSELGEVDLDILKEFYLAKEWLKIGAYISICIQHNCTPNDKEIIEEIFKE